MPPRFSAVVAALNRGGIVGYAAKPWEPEGLRAMVAGAAEQRRLRKALAQEQALLHGLMDHIPAEVAFKDREGRYVQLNALKAQALGAPPAELLGRTEQEVTGAPASRGEREALRTGRPVAVTVEQATPAGPAWTQIETVPIADEHGEVSHLAVISRDVTAQKLAEIQLRQSDKLRALGTLAGGVAHDFNNLLAAIMGSLELAGRRLGDEAAVRKYLDSATAAAERGASLTRRLLGFSRQNDSRPGLLNPSMLLAGMQDLMAQTLGPGVEVDWRIAKDLWPVVLEGDQLELGLLNLGVNARDAMGGVGKIRIKAENVVFEHPPERIELAAGDYVAVTVADSGHGMSPETLGRIMEPFFTTKPPGSGTGLGLPIVYSFVQRSGGAMDITSKVGEGTTVTLYLPRGVERPQGEQGPSGAAAALLDRKLCVLVVDDEPMVREITADFLRDLGHEVLEASNGKGALEVLDAHRESIDLAVIDFAMPGMNGVDFALAARTRRPDLPVVLLTGYFDLDSVPTDVSIMHKPFTDTGLLEAISGAISSRQSEAGKV